MKIVTKKADELSPKIADVDSLELDDMQTLVGGLIECLQVSETVDMWLNEEGKLIGLPTNILLCKGDTVVDTIQGDVFFASHNSEGETTGLTEEDISWVYDKLSEDMLIGEDPVNGEFNVFLVWNIQ